MNIPWPQRLLANRWILMAVIGLFGLHLSVAPVVAQDGSSSAKEERIKKKKQVQQMFKKGQKSAQSGNYGQAADTFEEALSLARGVEWEKAIQMSQDFLVKSLTQAGTEANKQENYEQAVSYYNRALKYVDNDPSVHYNRGLALVNIEDSTEAGLKALQKAIEIGNQTGNTRVAGLATERIRDEFIARASKALQGDNPSQEQINTALDALDQMREYVDPNAKSMFYRATALFKDGEYEQAIRVAREGLDMHQGSRSDAAKYYYVIGESQFTLGSKASACETFKNAAYGDYEARANHYLENECDDL
jgi:tetratricopeptide (TPR) repeat protein